MESVSNLKKEALVDLVVQQKEHIAVLEQQLREAVARQFGIKSEKVSADQLALFEKDLTDENPTDKDDTITVSYKRNKKRGKRKPCDENLERHTITHELEAAQRQCECGNTLEKIGVTITEQYEIIPARYIVIEHAQHKYACSCCKSKNTIKLAPKTPQILPKTNASAGLLSQIAVSKFVDGVPLHRQEPQHYRAGINLPRNTMARWLMQLSAKLIVLTNLFEDAIRAGPYIQCDESPFQVLKEIGRKVSTKSYIWVRCGGLPGQMVVLYNYYPNRSSEVVHELFDDWQGYVQCDGYAAYNCLEEQGITLVGCMAHARRKFVDALKTLPTKEAAQKAKAATAVKYFKRLYAIESVARNKTEAERYAMRQLESVPILSEFKAWLDQQAALPKSPLGRALTYTLNQWEKLARYCDNGMIEIDNNRDERAVRPFAIGRKNWMFADTPKGAHTNARFYSLIETCKLHGLEPYAYLKYVFKELPLAQTVEDFEALLPWRLDAKTLREAAREI